MPCIRGQRCFCTHFLPQCDGVIARATRCTIRVFFGTAVGVQRVIGSDDTDMVLL